MAEKQEQEREVKPDEDRQAVPTAEELYRLRDLLRRARDAAERQAAEQVRGAESGGGR